VVPPTAIADRLSEIRSAISRAAEASARSADSVRLVAISKTHPVDAVRAAIVAGQRDFGENTIQEALPKIAAIGEPEIGWHFIGHLQSNKAKHVPGHFQWLHAIDDLKIAQRVSRFAVEQNTKVNTLIEVNITRDPKKHGAEPELLVSLLERLLTENLRGLHLRGLMAMGPYPADEAQMRTAFAAVRELRDQCVTRFGLSNFDQLSMGMSGDFVAAIKEGATMVRIGTAIFGDRDYSR